MPISRCQALAVICVLLGATSEGCKKNRERGTAVSLESNYKKIRPRLFSPTGQFLACAANDTAIVVFDTRSGDELGKFSVPSDPDASLEFSKDGSSILFVSKHTSGKANPDQEKTVCVCWNTESNTERFRANDLTPNSRVKLSPSGRWLAIRKSRGTPPSQQWRRQKLNPITIVDLDQNNSRVTLAEEHVDRGNPDNFRFMENGRLVVLAAGQLFAYSPETGELLFSLKCWGREISTHTPNTMLLVSRQGETTSFLVADLIQQGNLSRFSLESRFDAVEALASLTNSGRYAAFVADGETVHIFDVERQEKLTHLTTNHSAPINAIAISPDGKRLLTASDGAGGAKKRARSFGGSTIELTAAELFMWDLSDGKRILTLSAETGPVDYARFSPNGTRILTQGNRTIVWDARSGEALAIGCEPLNLTKWGPSYSIATTELTEMLTLEVDYEPTRVRIRRLEF